MLFWRDLTLSIILVVLIRSLIAFFTLLLLVRLMGKQQVAELTFFDYVVGITIGSIASTLSVSVNQNTVAYRSNRRRDCPDRCIAVLKIIQGLAAAPVGQGENS